MTDNRNGALWLAVLAALFVLLSGPTQRTAPAVPPGELPPITWGPPVPGFDLLRPAFAATGESPPTGAVASLCPEDLETAIYRAGIAAVDTDDVDVACAAIPTKEIKLLGRPNLRISARFQTAGQSCKVLYVACCRLGKTAQSAGTLRKLTVAGPFTLTAISSPQPAKLGGRYCSDTIEQHCLGGWYGYVLLVSAPASGTVDLGIGTH